MSCYFAGAEHHVDTCPEQDHLPSFPRRVLRCLHAPVVETSLRKGYTSRRRDPESFDDFPHRHPCKVQIPNSLRRETPSHVDIFPEQTTGSVGVKHLYDLGAWDDVYRLFYETPTSSVANVAAKGILERMCPLVSPGKPKPDFSAPAISSFLQRNAAAWKSKYMTCWIFWNRRFCFFTRFSLWWWAF